MSRYSQNKPPSCIECPLYEAPGPVCGDGDPRTAVLGYIAQNPGQHEVADGVMRPLVGPSGKVFNRQCFEAGVPRNDLFVTNQVKCLTPNNRPPTAKEIACCKPLLQKELDLIRADTIMLAGEVPFKENIGHYSTLGPRYKPTDSIMARMGCVEQKDGRKWIGTIHPAFVMRMPEWTRAATEQLRKGWSVASVKIPLPTVHTDPDAEQIEAHRAAALKYKRFADDVETNQRGIDLDEDDFIGGDWDVEICGFSAIYYEAIILPKYRLAEEWANVWNKPNIMQCEHNGPYEYYHLSKIAPQLNWRWDTMHAMHYLRNWHASSGSTKKKKSGTRLALKPACLSVYTNLPYYNRDLEDAMGKAFYCGMDNIATLLAARKQYQLMETL